MKSNYQPYELSLYSKRINEYPNLTLEEELELARRYREGDKKAGQSIINSNLRLALKISRAYFHHGHNPLEIVQEANMGLVKALTMFEPERNIRFFSYAVWWVHAHIKKFVYKSSRGTLGHAANLLSLDTTLSDHENSDECFIDHLPSDAPCQEDEYFARQKAGVISQILYAENGPLNPREVYILERRFFEEPRPTLGQLSQKLNITRERIRQIENSSLAKLRNHMRKHHALKKEDFMESSLQGAQGRGSFPEVRAAV
ncbi:MAG TPA: sigma-70 family RNA polymerase sigma factor [Deltaproteobacteria bacterium]|nr:sigma-70 family RNA polymerase sigma factor [Deltaproteobacteria bacterium]HOI06669.1 sigma-70 family RNA polymerase sigma factor [Deltaproteobacteria bacterium]